MKREMTSGYYWILYRGKWSLAKFTFNEYNPNSYFDLIEDKSGFPLVNIHDVTKFIEIPKPTQP